MKQLDLCELEVIQGGKEAPVDAVCGIGVGLMGVGVFTGGTTFLVGAAIFGLFCLTSDTQQK